ncbi:beta-phosphoglucomutase family hydrolase [Planosporangium flavigriseum]|uniref:Beta-phosphoglucomutase n=1 Tax=Planosporangium flavigriseum TaxID=373681 RepID=A0A8J3LIV3_9ACTN|nr:beta-phosphoglucomutase family hydrolase [Planosporangium flavigriseum]NJC63824.1 beta-phosphoglucomutase family hydrolase [Planosporangium flavigriseum]GIG73677.1 hydrolase [Planosporangium flavigriseum]
MLGLPAGVRACLFDLDGVLTPTAAVHAAAWKELFDDFLRQRAARTGEKFRPFDPVADYDEYVDGRPRADGTRSFLASRNITLPEGEPDDPPDRETIQGLSARKDAAFSRRLHHGGVEPYEGSVRYLQAARDAGLRRAVVSASKHCAEILRTAGIDELIEERVDGIVAAREGLRGKPAPDTYLYAAQLLGVEPAAAAVFEDALAGVEAGRAGGFGYVVGVDRVGQSDALRAHGADVVVKDLAELLDRADPEAAR